MGLKPGTLVRMTRQTRQILRWRGWSKPRWLCVGLQQHVREFGRCVGVVEGPIEFTDENGETSYGPEVNIRWKPSNLRYAYDPKSLEVVRKV